MSTVPASTPPLATGCDRFLAALPESFRDECRSKLDGSKLDPNHPLFVALAELYENDNRKPAPNYVQEVTAFASQSKQFLEELQSLPMSIAATIEKQLMGLLSEWRGPLDRLATTSLNLQRNVETLPGLLLAAQPQKETREMPKSEKGWDKFRWWVGQFFRDGRSTVSHPLAWIVTGSITFSLAVTLLVIGAGQVSRSYERAYQERLGHMEADSAANTVALNELLSAGIALKVERSKDANAYFLILPGAHKAAQPVNSPEGLAVEVWP